MNEIIMKPMKQIWKLFDIKIFKNVYLLYHTECIMAYTRFQIFQNWKKIQTKHGDSRWIQLSTILHKLTLKKTDIGWTLGAFRFQFTQHDSMSPCASLLLAETWCGHDQPHVPPKVNLHGCVRKHDIM